MNASIEQRRLQLAERESNARTYARGIDRVISRGELARVYDSDGREYLDCLACAGALPLGHNHPFVQQRVADFLQSGQLQQALSQAGFDPAAGGINLSLRGDGSAQSGGSGGQPGDSPRGGGTGWSRDQADAPQEIAPIRHLRGYGGVDMRI